MALVRVRKDGYEFNVGENYAEAKGLEVIDEPTHVHGRSRRPTRLHSRPIKPKKSVDQLADEKGAQDTTADAVAKKAATPADITANPPSLKEN